MKLRSQCAVGLVALAAILFLTPRYSLADSEARIVRLSQIEGKVQIDRNSGEGFEKAIVNMPITQGMRLETGSDGRAETEFEDGTVVRLAPNSALDFQQIGLSDSGEKASRVAVRDGTAFFDIRQKKHSEFTVVLPGRDLPVAKAAHFRVDVDRQNVTLAVFGGELRLENKGKQLKVKKGEQLTLGRGDDGTYLAKSITPQAYDSWDMERNSFHNRYYEDSAYGSYPYYGRGDLNYYGSWYWLPGYGELWRPNSVGFGFDPFYNGYWSWYPSLGYTWVSGYPWGWLPYRYGSWTFVPGWGWGWLPGRYWTSWATVPVIVNPPVGYVLPVRPSIPNAPAIIPVPRGGPFKPPAATPPSVIPVPRGPQGPRHMRPPSVKFGPPAVKAQPAQSWHNREGRSTPMPVQPQRLVPPNSSMQRPLATPVQPLPPAAKVWHGEGMGMRGITGKLPAGSTGFSPQGSAARTPGAHTRSGHSR